jgi:hypothetical protein
MVDERLANLINRVLGVRARNLMLADDLEDGHTGYLIERALDEARSQQFTPTTQRSTLRG